MQLQGSICALVTPFDSDGSLDIKALQALIDWHAEAGTSALVIAGSTGEGALISEAEYETLIAESVRQAGARLPIIAGIGAPATATSLALAKRAAAQGAQAVLAVTPYYVRPTQAGLLAHYRRIADSGGLPVVLYNVPGRTGCDLLPETVAELAQHPGIIGVKEAVAEPGRMHDLLRLAGPGFCVLSGDDPTALRAMTAGAVGTISVAANIVPRSFARLCAYARRGDFVAAGRIDTELQNLYRALGVESNPIPAKWLLQAMGRLQGQLRLPLHPLSEAHHEFVGSCLPDIHRCEATMTGEH